MLPQWFCYPETVGLDSRPEHRPSECRFGLKIKLPWCSPLFLILDACLEQCFLTGTSGYFCDPAPGRNSPTQFLLASDWQVWLILPYMHTQKSSWSQTTPVPELSAEAWTLLRLWPFSLQVSTVLTQRNLWRLIPSWARPVRATILVLATAKCKNPVNHEVLFCYKGNLNLTPPISSKPLTCASGPVVRPDL